jgi:lipoyl(octanoyl) transferase
MKMPSCNERVFLIKDWEMFELKLQVLSLGKYDYDKALKLQEEYLKKRQAGEVGDRIILVEHNPVLTLGRSGKRENIIASDEVLEREGIEVVHIGRGGDVTYHGPGQIVGYPIIDLKGHKLGVKDYVYNIEEMIIRLTSSEYGIESYRDEINNGVWVNNKKITAVGFSVKRWVTMHGFALNVNTDLNHFKYIVPCGIEGREATSLEAELGRKLDFQEVNEKVLKYFCEVFNYDEVEFVTEVM